MQWGLWNENGDPCGYSAYAYRAWRHNFCYHSDYDDDLRYVDSYCIDPDQILLSAQEMLKPAVEVFFITITTINNIIIIDTTPSSRLAYKSVNWESWLDDKSPQWSPERHSTKWWREESDNVWKSTIHGINWADGVDLLILPSPTSIKLVFNPDNKPQWCCISLIQSTKKSTQKGYSVPSWSSGVCLPTTTAIPQYAGYCDHWLFDFFFYKKGLKRGVFLGLDLND